MSDDVFVEGVVYFALIMLWLLWEATERNIEGEKQRKALDVSSKRQ